VTTIDLYETNSGDLIVAKDAINAWLLAHPLPADARFDDDATAWAAGVWEPGMSIGHIRINAQRLVATHPVHQNAPRHIAGWTDGTLTLDQEPTHTAALAYLDLADNADGSPIEDSITSMAEQLRAAGNPRDAERAEGALEVLRAAHWGEIESTYELHSALSYIRDATTTLTAIIEANFPPPLPPEVVNTTYSDDGQFRYNLDSNGEVEVSARDPLGEWEHLMMIQVYPGEPGELPYVRAVGIPGSEPPTMAAHEQAHKDAGAHVHNAHQAGLWRH
jgi:hypothetical protein